MKIQYVSSPQHSAWWQLALFKGVHCFHDPVKAQASACVHHGEAGLLGHQPGDVGAGGARLGSRGTLVWLCSYLREWGAQRAQDLEQ